MQIGAQAGSEADGKSSAWAGLGAGTAATPYAARALPLAACAMLGAGCTIHRTALGAKLGNGGRFAIGRSVGPLPPCHGCAAGPCLFPATGSGGISGVSVAASIGPAAGLAHLLPDVLASRQGQMHGAPALWSAA